MKVIPLKDFIWDRYHPHYKKDVEVEVEDDIGSQMLEFGYAVSLEIQAVAPESKAKIETDENKMVDLSTQENKSVVKKAPKKTVRVKKINKA